MIWSSYSEEKKWRKVEQVLVEAARSISGILQVS